MVGQNIVKAKLDFRHPNMETRPNPLEVAELVCMIASHLGDFDDLNNLRRVSKFHRQILDDDPNTQRALWRKPPKYGLIDFDKHVRHNPIGSLHPTNGWNQWDDCKSMNCKPVLTQNPVSQEEYDKLLGKLDWGARGIFNPLLRKILPKFIPWLSMICEESVYEKDCKFKTSYEFEKSLFSILDILKLSHWTHNISSMPEDWNNQFMTQPPVCSLTIEWSLTYVTRDGQEPLWLEHGVEMAYRQPEVTVRIENSTGIKLGKFIEALATSARELNVKRRTAVVPVQINEKWTRAAGLVMALGNHNDGKRRQSEQTTTSD